MLKKKALRTVLAVITFTICNGIVYAQQLNKPAAGNVTNPTVNPVPAGYATGIAVNAIRTYIPVGPFTDYNAVLNAGYLDVNQNAEYIDGLGRSLQTVSRQLTPGGKDMVTPMVYDAFGRPASQYLPYVSAEQNGLFKMDPFNEQKNFMQGQYNDEQVYYSQKEYEASPLNRVTKIMAQGNSWAGSGRGVTIGYLVNVPGDGVRVWTMDVATNISQTIAEYDPGVLYKRVTKDEDGNGVVEYTDKEQKVILRKVQVGDVPADYSGYDGFLCTYYVYDDLGQLRFVIPPKAVAAIRPNWQLPADVINELCFRYEYDPRQRMIAKKVPGAGWTYLVYDLKDRVVFSQDANLHNNNKWITTLYDALDRPVMTGIMTWTGSPAVLQQTVDAQIKNGVIPAGLVNDLVLPLSGQAVPISGVWQARYSVTLQAGFESSNDFTAEIFDMATAPQETTIDGVVVNTNPIPGGAVFVALTKKYYDDYSHTAIAYTASYNNKLESGNNRYPVTPPADENKNTNGLATVSQVKVLQNPADLSVGTWLTTVTFYDNKGRIIQTNSDNHKGGKDITTQLYDYTGNVLCTYLDHTNPSGTPASLHVRTRMEYDQAGRLQETKKVINDNLGKEVLIAKYGYDERGQIINKQVGRKKNNNVYTADPIEVLTYSYNIRGWLTGINKDYANGQGGTGSSPWFGMELNYDKGFEKNQYTGNVAGTKWRSRGDGERRSFGYAYDKSNRLLGADFAQFDGSNYVDNGIVNFDMTMGDGVNASSAYDENGNIKAMKQWGLKLNASQVIDDLLYKYFLNSNKLSSVTEQNTGTTTHNLGDFTDNNGSDDDYGYDENGNTITDKNKRINGIAGLDKASGGAITYNHLNLATQIAVKTETGADRGTIAYVYDASGVKLTKVTLDKNVTVRDNGVDYTTDITTTTNYVSECVYESKSYSNSALSSLVYTERLAFATHEEGRIRYVPADGNDPATYEFDYFIRDHLGNVRMVLTEEQKTSIYQAGMEDANRDFEVKLFGNKINTTLADRVDGFDGYPLTNKKLSKVNGGTAEGRVGPGVILKVMAGDKFTAKTFAWYKTTGTGTDNSLDPALPALIENVLGNLVPGISGVGKGTAVAQITNSIVQPGMENLLNNRSSASGTPKAFLNWVLLDEEQFKAVNGAYGAVPVPQLTPGQEKVLLQAANGSEIEISKNGYLYVFVSNESKGDVYFDDIRVEHIRGPLMEETHYYPFGLAMAGISSKALGRMENAYKFNGGIELNDDLGIATYETLYRGYDAQIGRFNQIDPLADKYPDWSPYSFAFNDPVYWNDPLGSDPDLNEIINNLWNAGGGTWTAESGEYDYFNGNDASMFITGSSYMAEFGGWGQNGAANSFASAQSNYYGMGGQNPIIGQLLEPVIAIGKYNKNGQWQTTNWGDLMNQLKKNGAEGFIEGAATNIANQYERKEQRPGYNLDNSVAALNRNAVSSSQGACAKYVRTALEAGGINTTGRPVSAKDYVPFLQKKGFQIVGANIKKFAPQKGDIAVMKSFVGAKKAHPHGHIQMFNGNKWVSDFKQNDFWPGSDYRNFKPEFTILRW